MANNEKIGILDPEGKNYNPLNGQPYSEKYREMAKKWKELPVYQKRMELIESIRSNQVTLLVSQTGSGKSITAGQLVLYATDYKSRVAFTLPKQLITKKLASFVAEITDTEVGKEIGYKYKGSPKDAYSEKNNKLLFATDGTIVSMLVNDPELKDFGAVIIDEAHERKVQIDFLLYLLRNTVKLRPDFKVIIMSATIDTSIFESYFSEYKFGVIDVGGARSFPIEDIFLDESISEKEYLDRGYDRIKDIVKSGKEGDIIFFVPSVNDAMEICKRISKDNLDIYCVEVYSGMDADREEMAVSKDKYKVTGKGRKLVVASPVAESSITFENLKYVIDSGYEFSGYYDPVIDAKVLEKKFISNGQAKQRCGRSGRTSPGVCYHLYTKKDYEGMKPFPEPNIRVSNIYQECLKLLNYPQVGTLKKLLEVLSEFIEPPKEAYVESAIDELKDLRLVDEVGITEFGKMIADFQIDPRLAVAVWAGKRMTCGNEVIAILATIEKIKGNLMDLFKLPNMGEDKQASMAMMNKFEAVKNKLGHKYGDHLSIYKIMSKYREIRHDEKDIDTRKKKLDDYYYKYFLKRGTIEGAYEDYKKYRDKLRKMEVDKLDLNSYKLEDKVMACILFAYSGHIAYLHDKLYDTKYANRVKISRNSFFDKLPGEVLYNELFNNNGKLELNIVSKVTDAMREIVVILNKK